ncbi:hypothetical protein [Burkholderia phage FLC8]|nr:hypothetical protein [Burkholderia phage FLC8]
MSALKEQPKLNKADAQMRELAQQATMVSGFQGGLNVLVLKRLLVFPDQPYNFIQVAVDLRHAKITSATDYNVKKAFRFLKDRGAVHSLPGNMFKLTQDMRELIFEVSIKNAKNRSKRQGLPTDPVDGGGVLS